MKKIFFSPEKNEIANWVEKPVSSKSLLPQWYKEISQYLNNDKSPKITFDGKGTNITIKKCMPFFDAISLGYLIVLSCDIFVTIDGDYQNISWRVNEEMVQKHSPDQIYNMTIPKEYNPTPFKWTSFIDIKTPKGYSTFFFSPLMRDSSPFYTLPGIVDTDNHNLSINFPFFLKKDFEGIIPAGTPIVQLFPFKRESWKNFFINEAKSDLNSRVQKNLSKISNFYKNNHWVRKNFN